MHQQIKHIEFVEIQAASVFLDQLFWQKNKTVLIRIDLGQHSIEIAKYVPFYNANKEIWNDATTSSGSRITSVQPLKR
jgi:hypothetical protein